MKNNTTFPVGYHDFNKNKAFNFQMNRLYSMGNARLEDLKSAGPKINSMEEWKSEMLVLAEKALAEKQPMQAAFYYRAAEFYITERDPEKEILYQKYLDCFYRAAGQDRIDRTEIPYKGSSIQTLRLQPENTRARGTIILHGGFDSFKEELYPMMRYFQQHDYEVINFETPWMGGARKKKEMGLEIEWEKLIGTVIDHYGLDEIVVGINLKG